MNTARKVLADLLQLLLCTVAAIVIALLVLAALLWLTLRGLWNVTHFLLKWTIEGLLFLTEHVCHATVRLARWYHTNRLQFETSYDLTIAFGTPLALSIFLCGQIVDHLPKHSVLGGIGVYASISASCLIAFLVGRLVLHTARRLRTIAPAHYLKVVTILATLALIQPMAMSFTTMSYLGKKPEVLVVTKEKPVLLESAAVSTIVLGYYAKNEHSYELMYHHSQPYQRSIARTARLLFPAQTQDFAAVIYGQAACESSFEPRTNDIGATGLMQVLSATDAEIAFAKKLLGLPETVDRAKDLANQDIILVIGARRLKGYYERFGNNLGLALLAYNMGPYNKDYNFILNTYNSKPRQECSLLDVTPYLQEDPAKYAYLVLSYALSYRLKHQLGYLPDYSKSHSIVRGVGIPFCAAS